MENKRQKLLKGEVFRMDSPKDNVFWLYLNSTGQDMDVEKNGLYSEVFPKLRKICEKSGLILQVVELNHEKFGCRWISCSQSHSRGCVLSLLGDRRGPAGLPTVINAKEFKELMKTGEKILDRYRSIHQDSNSCETLNYPDQVTLEAALKFLHQHYEKDQNSIPPKYYLQPGYQSHLQNDRNRPRQNLFSSQESQSLSTVNVLTALQTVAKEAFLNGNISSDAMLKYFYPALDTFAEIQKVSVGLPVSQRFISIKRQFQDLDSKGQSYLHHSVQKYFDCTIQNRQMSFDADFNRFCNDLEKRCQVSLDEYKVKWHGGGLNLSYTEHQNYYEKMLTNVLTQLKEVVESLDVEEQQILSDKPDDYLCRQLEYHSRLSERICSLFCGLWEIMSQISEILQSQSIHILLHGKPGCGKTYLCAKIVELFSEVHGSACIKLYRFLGTFSSQCNILSVLRSICLQLYFTIQDEVDKSLKPGNLETIPETLEFFHTLLSKVDCPVLILLDGINHFKSPNTVISAILKSLPSNVTCVLSMSSSGLPNTSSRSSKRRPNLGTLTTQLNSQTHNLISSLKNSKDGAPCLVAVPPFSSSAAVITMDRVLKDSKRCLTAYQRDQIMTAFSQSQNALCMKLITMASCYCHSFSGLHELVQGKTICDILKKFFGCLENMFGKELLRCFVCYVTESKNGLSTVELISMIQADSTILSSFPPQKLWYVPHMVLKLLFELDPLLTYRQLDGRLVLLWSHSVLKEFVHTHYLSSRESKGAVHTAMASYWLTVSKQRGLKLSDDEQSLRDHTIDGDIVRSLVQFTHHVIHSGNESWMKSQILSPKWLISKFSCTSQMALMEDFLEAQEVYPCQGYKSIADCMAVMKDCKDNRQLLMDMTFHLQQRVLDYPTTVGKLCENIMKWFSSQPENNYVMCIGPASSSGPLLRQFSTHCAHACVSTYSHELITITDNGFLVCYDLHNMAIIRVKRMLPWSSFDSGDSIVIHQNGEDLLLLLLFGQNSVCVFDLISMDHIRTISLLPNSASHYLSPKATYIVSHTNQGKMVLLSCLGKTEMFNSTSQPGQAQRHLIFTENDKFEVFEDILSCENDLEHVAVRFVTTSTSQVKTLTEYFLPKGFKLKACTFLTNNILIGVVQTSNECCPDLPSRLRDKLQTIHVFNLSGGNHNLDIKLTLLAKYLCCNKSGDQMLVGNEDLAFVYKLPFADICCEIKDLGCKEAILGEGKVVFYGESNIQVYSSRSGNLISQWASVGSPADKYWLTDDNMMLIKHTHYRDEGKIQVWELSDKVLQEEMAVDPPFQCLAYCRHQGLLCGVTHNGYIATMDTLQKAFCWSISSVRINHKVDCLLLANDASLMVALGTRLSLVDLTSKKLLITTSILTPKSNGMFVDGCLSNDKKSIVALEKGHKDLTTIHIINVNDLSAAVVTYPCVSETVVLRSSQVLFLPTQEGRSNDSLGRDFFHAVDLFNSGSVEKLDIGMPINQTSYVCFSPDESQLAVISAFPLSENSDQVSFEVTLFDTNHYKMDKKYTRELEQRVLVTKAFFLWYYIIVLTDSSVIILNLLTEHFGDLKDLHLTHPTLSQDERFMAAVKHDDEFKEIVIIAFETGEILLNYQLNFETCDQFMASSQLDILLFFVKGMAHPAVLDANESLRKVLNPNRTSSFLPYFVGIKTAESHSLVPNEINLDKDQNLNNINQTSSSNVRMSGNKSEEQQPHESQKLDADGGGQVKKSVPEISAYTSDSDEDSPDSHESSTGTDSASSGSTDYTSSSSGSSTGSDSNDSSETEHGERGDSKRNAIQPSNHNLLKSTSSKDNPAARADVGTTVQKQTDQKQDLISSDSRKVVSVDTTNNSSDFSGIAQKLDYHSTSLNYFQSSESEAEYDGGAEDSSISETDCHIGKGHHPVRHDSTDTDQNMPMKESDSSGSWNKDSFTDEQTSNITEERQLLVHGQSTCNYFISEDEHLDEKSPREESKTSERQPGTDGHDRRASRDSVQQKTSSRSCVLM